MRCWTVWRTWRPGSAKTYAAFSIHPYVVEHLHTELMEAIMDKAIKVYAEVNHYDPADVRRDMEQYPDYKEMVVTMAAQIVLCETYINEKLKAVK